VGQPAEVGTQRHGCHRSNARTGRQPVRVLVAASLGGWRWTAPRRWSWASFSRPWPAWWSSWQRLRRSTGRHSGSRRAGRDGRRRPSWWRSRHSSGCSVPACCCAGAGPSGWSWSPSSPACSGCRSPSCSSPASWPPMGRPGSWSSKGWSASSRSW